MATFRFVGRDINIHWNGYDIKGPAGTVFSIPDQLYEEFEADLRGAEPSLQWIDINEFQSLSASVSAATLSASSPITIANTSTGRIISFSSGTASNGSLLTADGAGGVIYVPASTSGITSVVGVSPISSAISGGIVSVSLNASYSSSTHTHPYIELSSITAKGDIIAGTAASSIAALGVGTDGQILSAASGATTGLAWINQSAVTSDNAARVRTQIRNTTGSTLTKGQVVYITGSSGLIPTVAPALANSDATSANTLGVVEADIVNNSNGYVTNVGRLDGLNTTGFSDGVAIWLSPTVAGAFQTAKPVGPDHGVLVGFIIKGGSAGAGEIYVYIKNGVELEEVHDVNITSVSNDQALIWSSTASVWRNSFIGSGSISAEAVGTAALATGAVVAAKIATGAVTSGHIASGAVGTAALATASVTDAKIATNAVTSGHILAGAVGTAALATGAVVAAKIATGAVTSGHIAAGAVGSAALAASSVVSAAIAANAVTSGHIAAGAVGSAQIATGAVVAGDIAANAVTSGNIASGSVDTSKISSGSATNGTILTANGSGSASFLPAPISGATLSVWSNSFTVVNGSVQTTKLNNNANTAASFSSIAVDDANNHLYQISSDTVIRKIDLSNNSVLATLTLTLTNSRLVDIAFGNGKLCVVSSPTTALGGHEYRIISASAMTVQNTGNILSASDFNYSGQWASVTYESSLDKFTIHSSGITASTGVPGVSAMFRGLFRIIDPSTYSTRVHRSTSNSTKGPGVPNVVAANLAGNGCSHPVWIASASRFVSGANSGGLDFYSDSGASSAFLTATGAATNGPNRFINDIKLSPSTAYPGLYFTMSSTVGYSYENGLGHVLLSAISAAYNSTVTAAYSYNSDIISPGTNKSGSIQDMNVALKNDRIILTLAGRIADMTYYNPVDNSGAVTLGVSVATTTSRLSNPAANATVGAGAGCGTAHQIGYNSASNQLYVISSQYNTTGSGSLHAIRAIVSSYSTYITVNSHTSDFILGTYGYSLTGTYANALYISSLTSSTMSTSGNNSIYIVTAGTSETTRYIGDLSGSNAVISAKYWSIKQ